MPIMYNESCFLLIVYTIWMVFTWSMSRSKIFNTYICYKIQNGINNVFFSAKHRKKKNYWNIIQVQTILLILWKIRSLQTVHYLKILKWCVSFTITMNEMLVNSLEKKTFKYVTCTSVLFQNILLYLQNALSSNSWRPKTGSDNVYYLYVGTRSYYQSASSYFNEMNITLNSERKYMYHHHVWKL
jgi:hypothetical protein